MIAAGRDGHTIALSAPLGHVWTWGRDNGTYGNLGRVSDGHAILMPGQISPGTFDDVAIASISAGFYVSMVVTVHGTCYATGHNSCGQLGVGNLQNQMTFRRVGGADVFGDGGVHHVSCGYLHTLLLSSSGRVWWSGRSCQGVASVHTPTLLVDVGGGGYASNDFCNERIALVAAGQTSDALVSKSGRLYMWGRCNEVGLGRGLMPDSDMDACTSNVLPQWVPLPGAPSTRLGRWHVLGQNRALTHAMETHAMMAYERLGDLCPFQAAAPTKVTQLIYGSMRFEPSAATGPGLRALMGFD
jgi:hypothetical protein